MCYCPSFCNCLHCAYVPLILLTYLLHLLELTLMFLVTTICFTTEKRLNLQKRNDRYDYGICFTTEKRLNLQKRNDKQCLH